MLASSILLLTPAYLACGQEESHDTEVIAGETGAIVIESVQEGDDGIQSNRVQVMALDASEMDRPLFLSDSNMPFGFGDGDGFSMLSDLNVQKDLELVDDQLQRINEVNQDFSKQIKEQMKGMHGEDGSFSMDRAREMGQMIRDLKAQQKEQLNEILLPQQQDRLKQVSLQLQMKRRSTGGMLAGKLAEELGITSEQKKRIKDRQKQLQKELDEKFAKMREEARTSLLEELTNEQRQKLEQLIGDKFESNEEDSKSRFNRRFKFGSGGKDRKDF